jgi:peptide/nickel transport system permease protein
MASYISKRLLLLAPTVLGVTLLTFAIIQITPGDPVQLALGPEATPGEIASIRRTLGLDRPVLVQYLDYVKGLLHGNLGLSIDGQVPVRQEIFQRLPSTLELAGAALLIAVLLGVGAGALAAWTRRPYLDAAVTAGALCGLSLPVFWVGLLGLYVFADRLHWVSALGGSGLGNLILPAVTVALAPAAVLAQVTRASMLENIQDDHVRTARSKGLSELRVMTRHVLHNALIPVVTVLGLILSDLVTGTVFVEVIFSRQGLGSFLVTAVEQRDFPQVQGVVVFVAIVYVLVNLGTDVLYSMLDPRVRLGSVPA